MATEANIEFEGEADDDALRRIQANKTDSTKADPKPQSSDVVDEDQVVPPGTTPFSPQQKKARKQAEKEKNKANREANRRRREQIADQRRLANQQHQDSLRAQRLAAKDLRQESKDQITQTRSDAVKARIQTYSLAASLGFPGYVAASVIDQAYLRPKEEKQVEAQKQYQSDLRKYEEGIRADAIAERRRTEEMLRNMPVQATVLDKNTGRPIDISGNGGGGEPPINANLADRDPERVPPRRPTPDVPSELLQMAGPAGMVATALIQAIQFINRATTSLGNSATNVGKTITSGTASKGAQAALRDGKLLLAGGNIPANVVVEGFHTLLNINDSILNSIQGTMAFSPQTMQASIERELANFGKQIQNAQKLDKITEQLVRANTQMDLAWQDLRAEFIQDIGPAIVVALNIITNQIKGVTVILDLVVEYAALMPGGIGAVVQILQLIGELGAKAQANELDSNDITKQIDDFFNVPLTVGRARRGTMP